MRNIQNSHILPRIFSAYMVQQHSQRTLMKWLLIAVSVVALALVVAIFLILRYLKRYRKMNNQVFVMNEQLNNAVEDLSSVNEQISETNRIKEEYIARFLELCSNIIDQADSERKTCNRLAREKRMEELYAELKTPNLSKKQPKNTTSISIQLS